MSIEAISWVLGSQVGDTTRKFVLAGFANHAHKDGRHAWPSIESIAEYVECSERTVQRAVRDLVADGWMREGDQQQVAHLRGDRRPKVYDLAMNEETRAAWKAAGAATPRGDTVTPRPGSTGRQGDAPSEAHGVTDGVTPVTPRGDTGVTQTVMNPRTTPVAPTTGCQRPGQRPHPNCRGCGTTNRQVAEQQRREADEARRREAAQAIADEQTHRAATAVPSTDPAVQQRLQEAREALSAGASR